MTCSPVCTVLRGDCRTVLGSADAFDSMLTDLPYSTHVHANAPIKGGDLGFASLDSDLRGAAASIAARCTGWSVNFSDVESVGSWQAAVEAAGSEYIRAIPWVRWSAPQKSGDRPPSGCEMVLLSHPAGKKLWHGPGWLVEFTTTALRGADKHPTEKPLDLALSIVSWFTRPGCRVVDPCAGSGTFGVACRLLGRHYIGAELDAAHASKANERLASKLSARDEKRAVAWVQEGLQMCEKLQAQPWKSAQRVRAVGRAVEDIERAIRYL